MQLLYVVDLEVSSHGGSLPPAAVYEAVVEHAKLWLLHSAHEDDLDLTMPGEVDLKITAFERETTRHANWTVISVGDDAGLTIDLRQALPGLDASFLCRASVTRINGNVALRIAMSRDTSSGVVSPIRVEQLRRPYLLRQVLTDARLECTVLGQDVDGRYVQVSPGLGEALVAAAQLPRRLPLLVIDSVSASTLRLATLAAHELAGLVRVACVRDSGDVRAFNEALPRAALPWKGARLVWPYLAARHPSFDEADCGMPEQTVSRLMRMVAPHSVSARGRDRAWETLLRLRRAEEAAALRLEVEKAQESGNVEEQLRLLSRQLAAKEAELDEYIDAFGDVELTERERQQLLGQKEAAEQEADYWRTQYFELYETRIADSNWWAQAPECADGEFDELFRYLDESTDGAICFTPAAVRGWKRSDYPFPEDMRAALILLARAACDYRSHDGKIGMAPDDWLKLRYGLNSAFSDGGLREAKLDKFEFDGQPWDRTPHIKLDDNTSPDRVGRIYFALDKAAQRFIVDHVGLKLYGL